MTTTTRILAKWELATEGLDRIGTVLARRLAEIEEDGDGLRGTSYDRDGGRSSSTPDPTGDAVIASAGKALDTVDRIITDLVRCWHHLEDAIAPGEDPRRRKQQQLELDDANAETCSSCARVDRLTRRRLKGNGLPVRTPAGKRRYQGRPMCRWCYDWQHEHGTPPPIEAIVVHAIDGLNVRHEASA